MSKHSPFTSWSIALMALAIVTASPAAMALSCFEPSPGAQRGTDAFAPVETRALSRDEQRYILNAFESLDGYWSGTSFSTKCFGSTAHPRPRSNSESVTAEIRYNKPDTLQVTAELYRPNDRSLHQERLRLILAGDRLRIDENTVEGDIELLQLKANRISVLVKNRQPGAVLPGGRRASIVREFVRTLEFRTRDILVTQSMFTNGELSGWSEWRLNRQNRR